MDAGPVLGSEVGLYCDALCEEGGCGAEGVLDAASWTGLVGIAHECKEEEYWY